MSHILSSCHLSRWFKKPRSRDKEIALKTSEFTEHRQHVCLRSKLSSTVSTCPCVVRLSQAALYAS